MKKFTKLLGIVLIIALVMSMGISSAFADVTISVERDNTYEADATGNRVYNYYQVFRATYNGTHTDATTGDHGYDSNGDAQTPLSSTGTATGFSYYLLSSDTAAVAAIKGTGNQWFDYVDSGDGSRTTISWKTTVQQTAENLQAAAEWLKTNCVIATGTLDYNDSTKTWSKTVSEGYYVIEGSEGKNLVAATTNISIKEKNSYPTIDKKQNDKSASDYKDEAVSVKVGDKIYYQVEVKIPADANRPIAVIDKMSTGLTYDSTPGLTVAVKGDTTGKTVAYAPMTSEDADLGYDNTITTTNGWQIKITPNVNTKGQTVVITFQATVNNTALTESDRKNDVTLKYGNTHYVMTDTVEYDIGAAAVLKYDGATAEENSTTKELDVKAPATKIKYLEASFKLTDAAGNPINVTAYGGAEGVGTYYVDSTSSSNVVKSDKTKDGLILIYGLDPEVSYYLTETATEDGYNSLSEKVPLTVIKAENSTTTGTGTEATTVSTNTTKVTYKTTTVGTGDNELVLTAANLGKIPNNSGTVLPSTGGVGTTIFYVVGSILVVAAGVLLITKKRMNREG